MSEILIVDDVPAFCKGLKALLLGEGYDVSLARNGEEALVRISEQRPDLVLLDVMMPKMNGFKCCEEIRKVDRLLPVIFLTAKDSDADLVRGMGLGADDFVPKIASDAVLLARIKRTLERAVQKYEDVVPMEIRIGSVSVDMKTYGVFEDGREISRLTKTEADLLRFLSSNRGEMFVVDDLITELRGNGFACEDAMLYSHISHLRQKLGSAGARITTVRGAGYCLEKSPG